MTEKPDKPAMDVSELFTDEEIRHDEDRLIEQLKRQRAEGEMADLGNGFFERMQPFSSKEK